MYKYIYIYIYIMINKGLETTQHLMLLQVSCVSSNHQAFI